MKKETSEKVMSFLVQKYYEQWAKENPDKIDLANEMAVEIIALELKYGIKLKVVHE